VENGDGGPKVDEKRSGVKERRSAETWRRGTEIAAGSVTVFFQINVDHSLEDEGKEVNISNKRN
jgi:hypothetical protein